MTSLRKDCKKHECKSTTKQPLRYGKNNLNTLTQSQGSMPKPDSEDVAAKLAAPAKKSLFERQKAEAEAKRLKEQAETAAVYEDFVKSFDNEEEDDAFGSSSSGFPKRHFPPQNGLGRGTSARGRGSGPGSLGPPSGFSRKRPHDQGPHGRENRHGIFAYDEHDRHDSRTAFADNEDARDELMRNRAQEKASAKPTLQLSSLPPGTSVAVVKSLISPNLTVDGVKFLSSGTTERKAATAIVTLAEGTPATEIDTLVSALQGKYLGWGFSLSISRHLSSAVNGSMLSATPTNTPLPFGAKAIKNGPQYTLSRAPPPNQRAFAPPSSFGPNASRTTSPVQVNVKPPSDLRQLKMIHKTVELIVTHGPEFEALLMSRPEIQKDEKWAWIWDPRSDGGVYYRWRLWDILTNAQQRIKSGTGRNANLTQNLFESGPSWLTPEAKLQFEYTTSLEDIVSNSDYDSSDEEGSGDESRKRLEHLQGGASLPELVAPGENDIPAHMNPLYKAKLIHLLSRLPRTSARLRRGDVARIMAFAISHASTGADEVVSILTLNVHQPFSMNDAISSRNQDEMDTDAVDERDKEDSSSAKLIGLYLISDILSSSSTSGVRHAWRYRALFEAALRAHKTFAHLGRLEKDLAWGKLRAEKWKRSVMLLLSQWEGWCVFPAQTQEEFVDSFNNPPLTEEEQLAANREERDRAEKEAAKSKWKAVSTGNTVSQADEQDIDEEAIKEELDGEPMEEDDLDGEPMAEDEDVDGDPMVTEEDASESVHVEEVVKEKTPPRESVNPVIESRRRRPKAEDMFADPDDG